MHQLDSLDHQLIAALRIDGRAPVSKLAASLGASRTTIQARIDRLLEGGIVLGFTIRVREGASGASIRAITLIEVAGRSTTTVIRHLRGIPELEALHTTNGGWDLVAEVRVPTLADLDRVLRHVRSIDGILNSETSILLSSI